MCDFPPSFIDIPIVYNDIMKPGMVWASFKNKQLRNNVQC